MAGRAFQRLELLFNQAVALPTEQRAGFLDAACGSDVNLRTAVEDLLKHDREGSDLEMLLVSPIVRETGDGSAMQPTRPMPLQADAPEVIVSQSWPKVPGYEILAELGRGGMGVVYRARQTSLNRDVALKMMLPSLSDLAEQLARFKTEAEALARLHHPNIVPIYEIGTYESRPYFTMEYVAGPNLARFLAGRPQEVKSAAQLIETLARAIHAVHQVGIVHRDLKPANVLLQDKLGYVPKITDFGIAKDQSTARRLTETGSVLGTPCYMAPEQVRTTSQGIGPAADIYALGSILYETLTGRPPFDAETATDTIVQLVNQEPMSPVRLRPRLPADLVTICLKCLEKSPRRRYATAQDLADDLRRFQAGEPIHARPVGAVERTYRWCRRHPLVTGLIALSSSLALALIVTIVVYSVLLHNALTRAEAKAEQERQQIVQLHVSMGLVEWEKGETFTAVLHFSEALQLDEGFPDRELSHRIRIATALRDSPRLVWQQKLGKPIVCTRLDPVSGRVVTMDKDFSVEIWDPETGRQTGSTLRHETEPVGGAISPDGRALAIIDREGTVRVWDVEAGKARVLPAVKGKRATSVSFHDRNRVLLARYAGASPTLWDLTPPVPVAQQGVSENALREFAVSDDGRWLLTIDANRKGTIRDGDTGKDTTVPWQLEEDLQCCAISRDGNWLAIVSGNRLRIWEVSAAKYIGAPVVLSHDVHQLEFCADSERLLTLGADQSLRVWQVRTGQQLLKLAQPEGLISQAHLSPDGKLVLARSTTRGVRIWDVATGQPLTPSLNQSDSLAAVGFRAGREQFITVSKSGILSLWELPGASAFQAEMVAQKEPAPEHLIVENAPPFIKLGNGVSVRDSQPKHSAHLSPAQAQDGLVEHAVFSLDGRRVAVRAEDGSVRIWDTASGEPSTRPLRHKGEIFCAAFSPDGLRLVTASEDGTIRVWDVVRGEELTQAMRPGRAIESVFFRRDSHHVVVFCKGGMAYLLDLSPDERPAADLVSLAEFLTGNQIDEKQVAVPVFP